MSCHRSSYGNTYFLVTCMFALLTVILATVAAFDSLFLSHQRLRTGAEDLSMLAADQMNMHDRAGRMNNLLALSRENAFNTGVTYVTAVESEPALADLAALLMNESRNGALLMTAEQKQMTTYTIHEMQQLLVGKKAVAAPWHMVLPWIESASLTPDCVDVGYVEGVDSSVHVNDGNSDLASFDSNDRLINPKTGLYFANRALTLPAPNNDLIFCLSSLPAPVKDTVSQARTIKAGAFKPLSKIVSHGMPVVEAHCQCVPSAVRITQAACEKNLGGFVGRTFRSATGRTDDEAVRISVCMVGTTNGAGPLPETIASSLVVQAGSNQ